MNNVPFQMFNTDFNQLTLISVTVKYTQTTWDQSGGVVRRPTPVSALNLAFTAHILSQWCSVPLSVIFLQRIQCLCAYCTG